MEGTAVLQFYLGMMYFSHQKNAFLWVLFVCFVYLRFLKLLILIRKE